MIRLNSVFCNLPALSQDALNASKWWLLPSYLSISARVCHMWRSGFRYDTQFFRVEPLRSFVWNVGADICWAGGFYYERGSAICPCAEREFLHRPLCKNVARGGTTASKSGCYILQVLTLEFVTHEIMTWWLVPLCAHTQMCTLSWLLFSTPLMSACLLLIHIHLRLGAQPSHWRE